MDNQVELMQDKEKLNKSEDQFAYGKIRKEANNIR